MPAILDLLESAENPITQVGSVTDEVEKYLRGAWNAGIKDAVDAGQIPEEIVGSTVETEGVAADLFTTAAEGAGLALSLLGLAFILILLILVLIAVVIVTLHRQIHHIASNIPVVGDTLSGWEDDAYNLIRPVLHGIEQQLITELTHLVIDLRKLIQWLYGIDPYRLVRFLEHFIEAHIHGIAADVQEITRLVHWVQSNISTTVNHLWSNVHALWTRLTYLENLITTIQQTMVGLWESIQLALSSIHDLWTFTEDLLSKLTSLDNLLSNAEAELQAQGSRIGQLESELSSMMDHVAWLESIVAPAAAVATIAGVLMPLAGSGSEGIDRLTKVADGECPCPPHRPELDASQCGWLEKILHAAGSSTHA